MYNSISKTLEKPPLYTKSAQAFWNDLHISGQMLKAHLDPCFEGASRKLNFMNASAAWIKELVPPSEYPTLLDIGCGPGIYAEQFAKAGYQVTGIDFSERSIAYAQSSARRLSLDIKYLYQDYLAMELDAMFDFATMIYCDYGALSAADRGIIMDKIYRHLKPGGCFLLDAFTMASCRNFQEKQTWELCPAGGFWREEAYLALNGFYQYTDNVTLEQISIFTGDCEAAYYLWTTYFAKETLNQEAVDAGFRFVGVFGDVAGTPYREDSPTIAMLFKK